MRRKFLIGCSDTAWKTYILNEFYYLFNELNQTYSWEFVAGDLNTRKALCTEVQPKAIIFCEDSISELMSWDVDSLKMQNVLIAAWGDDLHMYSRLFTSHQLIDIFNKTDVVFSTYGYYFEHYMLSILNLLSNKPKIVWIPHSASPEFVSQKFRNPTMKILLAGAVSEVYPLRLWLKDQYAPLHLDDIETLSHPGYGVVSLNNTRIFAKTINSYLAGITCTSLYRYVVAKVFEIPAVGSLLMINKDLEAILNTIGFKNFVNCIFYDDNNPLPLIKWVLNPKNRMQVDKIRWTGKIFIERFHQTFQRSMAMNHFIEASVEYYPYPLMPTPSCPNVHLQHTNCIHSFEMFGRVKPKQI